MSTQLQSQLEEDFISLAQGIHYQWLDSGRLIIYEIQSDRTEAVDALVNFALKTLNEWDRTKPCKVLYHVPGPEVKFTPYLRRRLTELDDSNSDLSGRVAWVVQNQIFSHAMRLFIMVRARKTQRDQKIFLTHEEAFAWLRECPE